MSTRSFICKEQPDGSYYGIYCHSDGYLTYNGAMLLDHYSDAQKVDELLSFGDMSSLNEKIYPDPARPHSFDFSERQKDVCVFYGRDRGEADTQAKTLTPEIINNSWCEYMYVFGQDGVWRYCELSHEQAPTKEDLISVESGLNHEYKQMGIKRPKDFYGFLCDSDIAQIRMMQEVLDDYDEDFSYKDNLLKKVKSELEEFKTNMLSKSPAEIYNEAGKIRFYEYMADYIQYEEISEEQSEALYKSDKHVLGALWDEMLDMDGFNIGNDEDADTLIDTYLSDNAEQM